MLSVCEEASAMHETKELGVSAEIWEPCDSGTKAIPYF